MTQSATTVGELEGIHAVVTGGADSTGLVVARAMAAAGARVHVGDIAQAALEAATSTHPNVTGTVADVSRLQDVARLFADARRNHGPVTALVNVVGVPGPITPIEEITDEGWARTFACNVHGTFYAIREAVRDMKAARSGSIVNFSTGSTLTNPPNRLAYVASKWAVEGMTRSLARELGPYGVRVNAIRPGMIDNARMRRVIVETASRRGISEEAMREQCLASFSMRSAIMPEELAVAVVFLCSPSARHITGQLLSVDGNIEFEA